MCWQSLPSDCISDKVRNDQFVATPLISEAPELRYLWRTEQTRVLEIRAVMNTKPTRLPAANYVSMSAEIARGAAIRIMQKCG